jgi:hypothetical protein
MAIAFNKRRGDRAAQNVIHPGRVEKNERQKDRGDEQHDLQGEMARRGFPDRQAAVGRQPLCPDRSAFDHGAFADEPAGCRGLSWPHHRDGEPYLDKTRQGKSHRDRTRWRQAACRRAPV